MEPKILVRKLIEALQAEKMLAQPYKNYAISDAMRLEAVIEKAITTTNIKPPVEPVAINLNFSDCICEPGQKPHAHCPVHGIQE